MKRIVNGVTYNTDTSIKIGEWTSRDESERDAVQTLYQTRGGAFFVVDEETKQVWNQREQENQERTYTTFTPMSRDQAQKWMLEGDDVEIFQNPFGDPPEATAEDSPGETVYMRLPATLKRKIERAAEANGQSVNVWMMRCAERCLEGQAN